MSDWKNKIECKKEYSLAEIAEIANLPIAKIKSWASLGIWNHDKTKVIRLKTFDLFPDFTSGKDLLRFLEKTNLY